MKVKERKQHRVQSNLWRQESDAVAEKKKKSLLDISAQQSQQMRDHEAQRQAERDFAMNYDAGVRAELSRENDEFDAYTASMISQWEKDGKNVTPILNSPDYVKGRGGRKAASMDHFSRLGFAAKNLPLPVFPAI